MDVIHTNNRRWPAVGVRARRAAAIAAYVLVLSSASAAAAPNRTALDVGTQPASIGANSCVGLNACVGASGNIGANSCKGPHACWGASGDIGDLSCVGEAACYVIGNDVGISSCVGDYSCEGRGPLPYVEAGSIGNSSCGTIAYGGGAASACRNALGTVGDNSCKAPLACFNAQGSIGDNSCYSSESCSGTAGSIGDYSCSGISTCKDSTGNIGDGSCHGTIFVCANSASSVGNCANAGSVVASICVSSQPDARIRRGAGAFVGDNIRNADGTTQTRSASAPRGTTITFGISAQNDATRSSDRFRVQAFGPSSPHYVVEFFRGTTNITADVLQGLYLTDNVAAGASILITARVTIKSTATLGSSVSRYVQISASNLPVETDTVKFTVKRS